MTAVKPVYLDYNATAPLRPWVVAAMHAAEEQNTGNPSSVHAFGRAARAAVEAARQHVADSVGVRPVQVIFTSGGTEANAMALMGVTADTVLMSAIEHPSVLAVPVPRRQLLTVTADGVVDVGMLEKTLSSIQGAVLLSVMHANNETGVIQPLDEIVARARAVHPAIMIHVDAVQSYGKLPLNFSALGVDMMTVAAHKVGGPKGVGALIVRDNLAVRPLLYGGGQERSRRAGTENVSALTGFGVLAQHIARVLDEAKGIEVLRQALEQGVRQKIYGAGVPRLPNTICIDCGATAGETRMMQLDLAGVAVSSGSACSSGKVAASHVLQAMGVDAHAAARSIRVSLGWNTTRADIDRFLSVWQQ